MRLALFDFDGTLTTRDSLMPFLHHAVGSARFALGLGAMSPILGAYATGLMRNDLAKQRVLRHFFGGFELSHIEQAGLAFAKQRISALLRPDLMTRLSEHQRRGDTCILVSASLSVYLDPWARAQGIDAVLCSKLAVDQDGRVSGQLEDGNCFGPEKLLRIERWLNGRKPEHVTAYGDSRGDREMLAFADEPHWVGSAK